MVGLGLSSGLVGTSWCMMNGCAFRLFFFGEGLKSG